MITREGSYIKYCYYNDKSYKKVSDSQNCLKEPAFKLLNHSISCISNCYLKIKKLLSIIFSCGKMNSNSAQNTLEIKVSHPAPTPYQAAVSKAMKEVERTQRVLELELVREVRRTSYNIKAAVEALKIGKESDPELFLDQNMLEDLKKNERNLITFLEEIIEQMNPILENCDTENPKEEETQEIIKKIFEHTSIFYKSYKDFIEKLEAKSKIRKHFTNNAKTFVKFVSREQSIYKKKPSSSEHLARVQNERDEALSNLKKIQEIPEPSSTIQNTSLPSPINFTD